MDIILLGSGNLGEPLKNFFSNARYLKIISLRNTSEENFKRFTDEITSKKIIFDLMDPNKIDQNTDSKLLKRANKFREIISKSNFVKQYVFFSTANLYEPSLHKIVEKDKLIEKFFSEYLSLKIKSEKYLLNLKLPLTICRIPNIWGQEASNSFFSDLFEAHRNKRLISNRKGDEEVISFININDLCIILREILKKEYLGIINISTDSFDSKKNLKAKVNHQDISSIKKLNGIRLSSGFLNWKSFLKKTNLPL